LISIEDAAIGLDSSTPRMTMPYSVSTPQILVIATRAPYWRPCQHDSPWESQTTRQRWASFEPVHAVVYFAPEIPEADQALGLKGFWMSYFAGGRLLWGPSGRRW
jgi:hypothetical protein